MTKEDYMRLSKERLAELLAERDSLEETIENKIAEKIAELLSKQLLQLPQQPNNPYQPISVLYGCPSDFPNITYDTDSKPNT
jgi:hypothetical protein